MRGCTHSGPMHISNFTAAAAGAVDSVYLSRASDAPLPAQTWCRAVLLLCNRIVHQYRKCRAAGAQ